MAIAMRAKTRKNGYEYRLTQFVKGENEGSGFIPSLQDRSERMIEESEQTITIGILVVKKIAPAGIQDR
jgi:hypothetical protein